MTNKPIERFTKAVEEAVQSFGSSCSFENLMGEDFKLGRDAALASIQAATASLLLELVGEDEFPITSKDDYSFQEAANEGRNELRAELRTKITDLRAEGGGDNE